MRALAQELESVKSTAVKQLSEQKTVLVTLKDNFEAFKGKTEATLGRMQHDSQKTARDVKMVVKEMETMKTALDEKIKSLESYEDQGAALGAKIAESADSAKSKELLEQLLQARSIPEKETPT